MAPQSATQYGRIAVKDIFQWTSHAAQEHWAYLAAIAVLIVLLWGWTRR